MASRNDWVGNGVGLVGGLLTSEAYRRWLPTLAEDPMEAAEIRDGVARGQRWGTYGVTGIRVIRSLVLMATGSKKSSVVGQGLDDLMEKIKEGKIVDAIKMPIIKGLGFDEDFAGALGELDIKIPELPEAIKDLLPKKKEAEDEEGASMDFDQDEEVAISAQDDELPGITQEDEEVAISAQDEPATSIAIS